MFAPSISAAVAEAHINDLIREADEARLARAASRAESTGRKGLGRRALRLRRYRGRRSILTRAESHPL